MRLPCVIVYEIAERAIVGEHITSKAHVSRSFSSFEFWDISPIIGVIHLSDTFDQSRVGVGDYQSEC